LKNNFNYDLFLQEKVQFFPYSFVGLRSGIRDKRRSDPGFRIQKRVVSGSGFGIRDVNPGSASRLHWIWIVIVLHKACSCNVFVKLVKKEGSQKSFNTKHGRDLLNFGLLQ
jgi:hypothetical protein